ncbi:MAG: hypothetical protein Q7S73_00090 [bacterium]|nr:hypothetical protein [bacterium]
MPKQKNGDMRVLDIVLGSGDVKELKVSLKTAQLVAELSQKTEYSAHRIYANAIQKYGNSEKAIEKFCSEEFKNPLMEEVLNKRLKTFQEKILYYTEVKCGECGRKHYLDEIKEMQAQHGVISDAHGVVEGYQFRFNCPSCKTSLRVDEDEFRAYAHATLDSMHS